MRFLTITPSRCRFFSRRTAATGRLRSSSSSNLTDPAVGWDEDMGVAHSRYVSGDYHRWRPVSWLHRPVVTGVVSEASAYSLAYLVCPSRSIKQLICLVACPTGSLQSVRGIYAEGGLYLNSKTWKSCLHCRSIGVPSKPGTKSTNTVTVDKKRPTPSPRQNPFTAYLCQRWLITALQCYLYTYMLSNSSTYDDTETWKFS